MIKQAVVTLWIRALGELHETDRPLKDDVLLQVLGVVVCITLYGGLQKSIIGAQTLRGAWLAGMHGGMPMAVVVLWWIWRQWGAGKRDAVALLIAILGAALVSMPALARFADNGTIHALKAYQYPVSLSVLAGFGMLYGAAWRSRLQVGDFGLGLGDWRWWLPRALLASVIIWVGVFVAIHTFDDLARFYPRVTAARHDFWVLMDSQFGMFLGIFGWEMLFRGILLWVFARRGDIKGAIEANAIIFFMGHITKPTSELFLSLPGGIIACWFGWRARSFVPVWLLHSLQLFAINFAGYWIRQ